MMSGQVIWITGLSGAGKSTLAHKVLANLRADGKPAIMLDGDEMRDVFGAVEPNLQNHSREARLALSMQYARLCRLIAAQNLIVIIATISLFSEVHEWNRANLPGYFEVFLRVPVKELRRRDPKGIYRRFDAGELDNVAGLDLPIDEPAAANWIIDYKPDHSITALALDLLKRVDERKI